MITNLAERLLKSIINNKARSTASISKKIITQPIKSIAAFIAAPFLLFKVIKTVENTWRTSIAKIGFVVGTIAAYYAGTLLGKTIAAFFITVYFGYFWGLTFWASTIISVFLTILFQIFVFNTIIYGFLHLSSEEVSQHLENISNNSGINIK